MIIKLQLAMSIATMQEEIVGVSVRSNRAMRQRFPRIISSCITLNFQRPTSRLYHRLLALCGCLLVSVKERFYSQARSMWNHVIFWICPPGQ